MVEEVKKEEVKEEEKSGEKEEEKPKNMVEKAEEVANRMEAANKVTEELMQRQEEVTAKLMLGGTAEAGAASTQVKETPREYAERKMKGQ